MSKRNISAIKQDTPAFLKRFKEQIGYKEGPTINDKKRAGAPQDNNDEIEDRSDPEDELPVIVNLKETGITNEEVQKFRDNEKEKLEIESTGGRIMFKKPIKTDKKQDQKNKKSNTDKSNKDTKHGDKGVGDKNNFCEKSKKSAPKNKTLLSFDDDEEDD